MRVGFSRKRLCKTFASRKSLTSEFGDKMSKAIAERKDQLERAGNLQELIARRIRRCHQLKGRRKGQFALDLLGSSRLIIEPDHDPVPRRSDGGMDLERIDRVRIVEVIDYH